LTLETEAAGVGMPAQWTGDIKTGSETLRDHWLGRLDLRDETLVAPEDERKMKGRNGR